MQVMVYKLGDDQADVRVLDEGVYVLVPSSSQAPDGTPLQGTEARDALVKARQSLKNAVQYVDGACHAHGA